MDPAILQLFRNTADVGFANNVAGEIRLAVADPGAAAEAVRRLDARRLVIASVELQQPSLDDVFFTLTGRRADEGSVPERQEQAA